MVAAAGGEGARELADLAQLHECDIMSVDQICAAKAVGRLLVEFQVHVAQASVVPDLPVFDADALCLVVHLDSGLVFPQQIPDAARSRRAGGRARRGGETVTNALVPA